MSERPLEVVCLMVGELLEDAYADKLFRMLGRHAGRDFRLTCLTDRERPFQEPIEQLRIGRGPHWRPDMRPTQHKIKLFQGGGWPYEEFLFLDVTLLIKSGLEPLLSRADAATQPLVTLRDWEWDTINTCFMRVRRHPDLAAIFEDYESGVRYQTRLQGDQDYVDASYKAHGLDAQVGFLPDGPIASYKGLRRLRRLHPSAARAAYEQACIVKFHGKPRPDDLFSASYWRWHLKRSPFWGLRDWGYLVNETREHWR